MTADTISQRDKCSKNQQVKRRLEVLRVKDGADAGNESENKRRLRAAASDRWRRRVWTARSGRNVRNTSLAIDTRLHLPNALRAQGLPALDAKCGMFDFRVVGTIHQEFSLSSSMREWIWHWM